MPLTLRIAGLWVLYAAWASSSGWILSAFQRLDRQGYAIAAIPAIIIAIWWWRITRPASDGRHRLKKTWLRAKRNPGFAAWLVVSVLILAGALIHPPTNYDGLTYRLPRLLYWLQENHWHWIGAIDFRLDLAGTGFEWMSAPLFLLIMSERGLFLLNFIPWLLLPGMFFIAAKGLGIRPRWAAWWMWVLPMAYGLAMQAGSIGNDLVGAAFVTASLAFAALAVRTRPAVCLALSALCALLMTGVKVTMLPLGLPLFVFWLTRAWKLLGVPRMSALLAALTPLAVVISFLPIALLCHHHTGTWTGNPENSLELEAPNALSGLLHNGVGFIVTTLQPPVLPGTGKIEQRVGHYLENRGWYRDLQKRDINFRFMLNHELPSEEGAGIGLGVTVLAGVWILSSRPFRRRHVRWLGHAGFWFVSCTAIAMLVFMAKVGYDSGARLMLPFTVPLILGLLIVFRPPAKAPSSRWALIPALFLLPTLILNPNRPLIPTEIVARLPGLPDTVRQRLTTVYASYSQRNDLLGPFRQEIPPDTRVGFAGPNDRSPLALFRPFVSREVFEVMPSNWESADWILATEEGVMMRLGLSLSEWEESSGFLRNTARKITPKARTNPETWILYRRTP